MSKSKKIIFLFVALIVVLSMMGCKEGMSDNQKGKYMFIRLKTNPTTGFDFKCDVLENSIGKVFLEDAVVEKKENRGLLGAPSHRTYIFSARDSIEGDVTIDFHYLRDWKGGEDGFHIYYDVYVDKNGDISFKEKRVEKVMIEPDVEEVENPTFADMYDIADFE